MKEIEVDYTLCQGHGRCYLLAPELFDSKDDEGHAAYLGGPIDEGDAARIAVAEKAIENCPEYALAWRAAGSADDKSGS